MFPLRLNAAKTIIFAFSFDLTMKLRKQKHR